MLRSGGGNKGNLHKHNIPPGKIAIIKAARNEVPLLLSLGRFSVFFIKACYSKQASSPTRHGEMMAMGMLVITNSGVGDLDTLIKKAQAGVLIKNLIGEGFSHAIDEIISTDFDRTRIRNAAFEYYNLSNAVLRYKWVYDSILNRF